MNIKLLFVFALSLFVSVVSAQDTIYFDKNECEIDNPGKAKTYEIIQRDSVDKKSAVLTEYFRSGKVKSSVSLVNEAFAPSKEFKIANRNSFILSKDRTTKWLYNGRYKEWYPDGKMKKDIDFRYGYLCGQLFTYWNNGNIKRKEMYNSGELVKGECFNSNGRAAVYSGFYTPPGLNVKEFASAQSIIAQKVRYPANLLEQRVAGRMQVITYTNVKGKVYKNVIRKSLHPLLDEQAYKLLLSNNIFESPAQIDGEPSSGFTIFTFVINNPKFTIDLYMKPSGTDTIYYDKYGFIQKTRQNAESMELLNVSGADSSELIQTVFDGNGVIRSKCAINRNLSCDRIREKYPDLRVISAMSTKKEFLDSRILHGKSEYMDKEGRLKCRMNYVFNVLDGEQLYYDEKGAVINRVVFDNGSLIEGSMPVDTTSLAGGNGEYIEKMPYFSGGQAALDRYIFTSIFETASQNLEKLNGVLEVRFLIDVTGSVKQVQIVRGLNADLDIKVACLLYGMPKWIPAMHNGYIVPVWLTKPIRFIYKYEYQGVKRINGPVLPNMKP